MQSLPEQMSFSVYHRDSSQLDTRVREKHSISILVVRTAANSADENAMHKRRCQGL
jgi:hypothetical protein